MATPTSPPPFMQSDPAHIEKLSSTTPTINTSHNEQGTAMPSPILANADDLVSSTSPPPPHRKSKKDSQHYDHDTTVILLQMMGKAGYGNRRLQKKSLKDVFAEAVKFAASEHKIIRSDKGWQKSSLG